MELERATIGGQQPTIGLWRIRSTAAAAARIQQRRLSTPTASHTSQPKRPLQPGLPVATGTKTGEQTGAASDPAAGVILRKLGLII